MRISECIKELTEHMYVHGDLQIVTYADCYYFTPESSLEIKKDWMSSEGLSKIKTGEKFIEI